MRSYGSIAELGGDYRDRDNSDYQVRASEWGGKEEFCHYILCLHKYKILTFTIFYLHENAYAEHTEVCVSLQGVSSTPPLHHFSDRGLGKISCLIFSALLILSYIKVIILKMGWTGHKINTNNIRNFENMGFSFMFYGNIACTSDQCVLPEENSVYMKKSNFNFRA